MRQGNTSTIEAKYVFDAQEDEWCSRWRTIRRRSSVDSGGPQGTGFWPLHFLCHINDLPDAVKSSVRLFTDDCLLYRTMVSKDHQLLPEDLKSLETCANDWGMRFNTNKMLSSEHKKSPKQSIPRLPNIRAFKVDNTHCKRSKKGQLNLGLSQMKIKYCPQACTKTAYISLVRSTMENGEIILYPYTESDMNRLERIQPQVARFITVDYRSRKKGVSPACL